MRGDERERPDGDGHRSLPIVELQLQPARRLRPERERHPSQIASATSTGQSISSSMRGCSRLATPSSRRWQFHSPGSLRGADLIAASLAHFRQALTDTDRVRNSCA